MHYISDEFYFANNEFHQEVSRLIASTPESGPINLEVPAGLEDILKEESFYTRTDYEDMPSKIALFGSAIMSLQNKDVYMSLDFPDPEEKDRLLVVLDGIKGLADGEVEVSLNGLARSLVDSYSKRARTSLEEGFTVMSGLVNYVGINWRLGNRIIQRT